MFVLDVLGFIFLASVLDKIALLLHVVGDKDFGHFDVASQLLLVLQLLVSQVGELVLGLELPLALSLSIVLLAVAQKRLFLFTKETEFRDGSVGILTLDPTYFLQIKFR